MSQLGGEGGIGAEDTPSGPMTLRLREGSVTPEGRRLGLTGGEVLLSVNGVAFSGKETALTARLLMRRGKPLALTFAREGGNLLVLAGTTALGRWEQVPALPAPEGDAARIDPDGLRNYEVMRGPEGQYDLYAVEVPLLAVIAPPLWLFQMRVWAPGATLLVGMVAAAIVTPWLSLVVWLSAALWIRGAALPLLRMDRQARGLGFAGVVAARSETEAHKLHQARSPGDRCIFCPEKETAAQAA
ncbi:MAG: hypothetical protein H9533_04485 [Rhodobacteraceae bacterium]|nr:hypothetical protein [Paracoccaceae bacterium]